MITILIADDHASVRQGLRRFLQRHENFSVVGEAQTGVEAVHLALRLHPSVVLMDINMPVMDGLQATREIKQAHPRSIIIGLSSHTGLALQLAMEEAGAWTYLTKMDIIDKLHPTICRLVTRSDGMDNR